MLLYNILCIYLCFDFFLTRCVFSSSPKRIRDHWHRQYNGRVRCCCGWSEGGTQPLFSGRIANRCDYRRLVTETENLDDCRDANEDHNLGFDDTNPNLGVDDIGCDKSYQSSQLNNPIPEDDDVCWEIQRFGYTEEGTLIRVVQLEIPYIFYLYVLTSHIHYLF